MGTLALVPQVVQAVRIPVIAAGASQMRRALQPSLALGAAGVQVGTAYLLCAEATTSAIPRSAQERRGSRHGGYQCVYRAARSRHREPDRAGGRSDQRGRSSVPLAVSAVAPLRAKPKAWGAATFHLCGRVRIPADARRFQPVLLRAKLAAAGRVVSCVVVRLQPDLAIGHGDAETRKYN